MIVHMLLSGLYGTQCPALGTQMYMPWSGTDVKKSNSGGTVIWEKDIMLKFLIALNVASKPSDC